MISQMEHYMEKIDILVHDSLVLNVRWSMENIVTQRDEPKFMISVSLDGNDVRPFSFFNYRCFSPPLYQKQNECVALYTLGKWNSFVNKKAGENVGYFYKHCMLYFQLLKLLYTFLYNKSFFWYKFVSIETIIITGPRKKDINSKIV